MSSPRNKRPSSGQSEQCKIQHRSDILMKEQIENINTSQNELKAAVVNLLKAKNSEIERCQMIIEELEAKIEKQMIILQVMHKINIELAYARADLDCALYQRVGDINGARKRVKWLEDKMGDLCGKKRLKSELIVSYQKGDKLKLMLGGPREEKEESLMQLATTEASQCMDMDESKANVSNVEAQERSGSENMPSSAEVPLINLTDSTQGTADTDQDKFTEMEKNASSDAAPEREIGNLSNQVTICVTDEYTCQLNDEAIEGEIGSDKDLTCNQKQPSNLSKDQVVKFKREDEHESNDILHPTFITEVTKSDSKKKKRPNFVCESSEDAARDYWNSEHHRFDLGDYYNQLIENDPISYHNLGVSVPGCFIESEDMEFTELPWRSRRRGSDFKDVHRIALDKLAVKLNGMYTKVYDAAMLSVLPSKEQARGHQEGTSRFLARDALQVQTVDRGNNATTSSSKSRDTFALPKVVTKKRGSSVTKMVYYPKPIPPPEVLPITRTSKSKEFPRYSDSFAEPGADIRRPASRIVDQRNLMDETKLVLYREKPKPKRNGPSTTEKRFRRMLERDRSASVDSTSENLFEEVQEEPMSLRKKLRQSFIMAKSLAKLQGGDETDQEIAVVSGWQTMKPKRKGNEYSGLRWERVKSIVHTNLLSSRVEERADAAKQLGLLKCGDTMVFYALKERLHKDGEDRVRYEAAKSLILIGCWDNEVLQVVLRFLVTGNTEIRLDLITTMTRGKNVQYVDKSIPAFKELVKVLSHFCCNPDPDDSISIEAAVLIGKLCVADANAKKKLISAMADKDDSHLKAKALEILVKQLNCTDEMVVRNIKDLLKTSPVAKHRALSTKLLISLGPNHPCILSDKEDIYKLLERKLWDEPSHEVRVSAGKALTALGMFARACESVEKRLEDLEEETRAEAVVSVGTLGMKSEKLTRLLLEMLELDTSEFVRIMIIRAFAILKLTDKRVLRYLKERERLEGALGVESRKAMKILESCQESTVKLQDQRAMPKPSLAISVK